MNTLKKKNKFKTLGPIKQFPSGSVKFSDSNSDLNKKRVKSSSHCKVPTKVRAILILKNQNSLIQHGLK